MSILLNLRSQKTNLHQAINSMILWDNRAQKRLVQTLHRLGISTSYDHMCASIISLSSNSLRVVREIANNPANAIMLPYDNFNWVSGVWETSILHAAIQHDQVSASLINLTLLGQDASSVTSVTRFEASRGTRHRLPPAKSLSDIVPSAADQNAFRENAITHVMAILTEEVASFAGFRNAIPLLTDPDAIPTCKTDRHYLPTLDQEQGSTRGNMVVLKHYFLDLLKIPKDTFENEMFFILGDRLTTARDRAAQDQRGVDRSTYRADHLSSLAVTSGLMHVCLNFIQACGKNLWGTGGDPIGLKTLRDLLPNRANDINTHKFDFYAWLRFLDCVLRALIISAAVSVLALQGAKELSSRILTADEFRAMSERIVDVYIASSPDRLEAVGIKSHKGNTICSHSVVTMFELMSLREMRDAIKHGHPTRILRMLKFWAPIFYAGRSYNYANECMELLHNLLHDWPEDAAKVLLAGMLVNTTGKPDGFLETDLDVEHLNLRIKSRAHGTNATPEMLRRVTPSLGHIRDLTDRIYHEIGVQDLNERHSRVQQHTDIQLLANHFVKSHAHDFSLDTLSEDLVTDLFRTGLRQLAGPQGGHAKHLARHRLHLRSRHGHRVNQPTDMEAGLVDAAEQELARALDSEPHIIIPEYVQSAEAMGEGELEAVIRDGEDALRNEYEYDDDH